VNAAKKLWQLSDDWEVNLLMNVFGPEKMGSFALAFDPAARFEAGGQLIDVVRRRRTRESGSYRAGQTAVIKHKFYANYIQDDDGVYTLVAEYLVDEGEEVVDDYLSTAKTSHTTFFEDSSDKLRSKGSQFNEMEYCKVRDLNWIEAPKDTFILKNYSKRYLQDFPAGYDRLCYDVEFSYPEGGPVVAIVDNFGFDDGLEYLHANVKQFCADHLEDYLPQCLSNARKFNAFYQLGELKDLPMMIKKTIESQRYLLQLLKDPATTLIKLDKALGNAYLNYKFGWQSFQQSLESLLRTPERAAKRFNYLLRKNSKRVSQRFTKTYNKVEELAQLSPSFAYLVPSTVYYEIVDEKIDFRPNVEVRCVVNTTINFPPLAVPKFSDSKYRDLLGLNPRVVDIYNLIPWTWLGDWFTGISKYLALCEAVLLDDDLINVGFVTCSLTSNVVAEGTLRMRDRDIVIDSSGNVTSLTLGDPVDIPYRTVGSMDYRTRFSVDDLFGAKSVLDKQSLLDETQKSILGALLTKFT
jgi:hypothetical protein